MRTPRDILELSGKYAERGRAIRKQAMVMALSAEMPYGEILAMTPDERNLLGEVLDERMKAMEARSSRIGR